MVHIEVSLVTSSSTTISRPRLPNSLSTPGCTILNKNMASGVASKRLFSEYRSLLTSPPDGITAGPVNEDDLFAWEALIQGPEGTPFEGGIFPAELKFPKDYPLNPPKMKFLGEIWHPNGMCLRISAANVQPLKQTMQKKNTSNTSFARLVMAVVLAFPMLAVTAGCASTPAHESVGEYTTDTALTAKVKAAA